jgi:hypothetical protein
MPQMVVGRLVLAEPEVKRNIIMELEALGMMGLAEIPVLAVGISQAKHDGQRQSADTFGANHTLASQ